MGNQLSLDAFNVKQMTIHELQSQNGGFAPMFAFPVFAFIMLIMAELSLIGAAAAGGSIKTKI